MRTFDVAGFTVVTSLPWLAGAALLIVSLVASLPLGIRPRIDGPLALFVAAVAAVILALVIVTLWLGRAIADRSRGGSGSEVRVLALGLPPAPEPAPTTPGRELAVGLVVPLTGVLLGAGLVALGRIVGAAGGDLLAALHWGLTWLGFGVLIVAAFVSLPLLPLDGGHIVRAVAWRLSGDLDRATRITTAIGRAFGYLVLGAGLLATLAGELLVGVWLLLLGWLATRVARGAAERARLERLTAGLLVSDAIDREPPTIGPTLTVDALMAQDEQDGARSVYPVVEDGRLAGVVFATRVSRRTKRRWPELRASDVMVPRARLRSLRESDPLLEAVVRLEGGRVAAFPVVADDDAGRLVGLVNRDDVVERLRARQAIVDARVGQAGRPARG
jgi:CBS domain-containing protein